MANDENLVPLTTTKAREVGRLGGIASGESKRRKKTLRDELIALLEVGDTQNRVSTALIQEAISGNGAGSVAKAFETIRDTIGEKPVEKVMYADVDAETLADVERLVEGELEESTE